MIRHVTKFLPYSFGASVPEAGFVRNELRVYPLACAIELKQRIEEKRRWVAKLSARQDELRVGDVNTERAGSIISVAKLFSRGHKAYTFCGLVININDVNCEKLSVFFTGLKSDSYLPLSRLGNGSLRQTLVSIFRDKVNKTGHSGS